MEFCWEGGVGGLNTNNKKYILSVWKKSKNVCCLLDMHDEIFTFLEFYFEIHI